MAGEREHGRRKEAICSRSTGKNTADNGGEEEEGKGTITRIFVGGLGASVTAEDLRKTFSSLGTVESLEIVRTKGRSFAYFDFVPSSIKSLPKLFSTYNGCMWKGGRLRLEKAREHYLLRLRQEWAEDAKLANSGTDDSVDVSNPVGSPKKLSNGLNLKKTEVRLFFPKLRKVKLLPFNGSGKHKYSFQRVEVPPLPIHFCDCEEHSDPSHSAKEKKISELETQVHGMDEKELNMMESVMKKLFEGENFLKPDCNATGLFEEGDEAAKSVDQLQDANAIDHMTDEDNLIMNLVAGGKNSATLLGRQVLETNSPDEGATAKLPTSKGRASENVLRSQKRKTVPSTKKRKFSLIEETDGIEVLSTNMKKKKKKSVNNNHSNESVQPIEVGSVSRQSNTNISWPQKSIGSELAGERDDTSFGTSHIKPGKVPKKDESKSDNTSVPYLSDHPNQNLVKSMNLESQPSLPNVQKEPAATLSNEPSAALNKSARGASWLQKSSWTQLVGGTNSSFSISQLLQGTTSKRQEQEEPKSEDAAMTKTVLVKSSSNASPRDGANASGVCTGVALTSPHSSRTVGLAVGLDHQSRQKGVQTSGKTDAAQKFEAQRVQPPNRNFAIGETCSFMRSAASMREWMSAKAALSGSLKKKNKEK